jgi:hypothetical protein
MISESIVDDVVAKVEASYLGEAVLDELRQEYPDIRFTYCSFDDIAANAKPVSERPGFKVYFVDSREHCACLTNSHEIASGIVLAEVFDDEDED